MDIIFASAMLMLIVVVCVVALVVIAMPPMSEGVEGIRWTTSQHVLLWEDYHGTRSYQEIMEDRLAGLPIAYDLKTYLNSVQ